MTKPSRPALRNALGGAAWAIIVALIWDSEGERVPLWTKVLLVPLLALGAVYAFYPFVRAELAVLQRKPDQIGELVGDAPSKLWAHIVLLVVVAALACTLFASGASFHAHITEPMVQDQGETVRVTEENKLLPAGSR